MESYANSLVNMNESFLIPKAFENSVDVEEDFTFGDSTIDETRPSRVSNYECNIETDRITMEEIPMGDSLMNSDEPNGEERKHESR